jgi:hypothetical protein
VATSSGTSEALGVAFVNLPDFYVSPGQGGATAALLSAPVLAVLLTSAQARAVLVSSPSASTLLQSSPLARAERIE